MLTIGQLAAHAGVTVRAVRHYHTKGLLPEPERDRSGYRRYDARDVVRLVRIRTLADAGVPLSRVQALLEASPEDFADAITEIDADLRARVRRLQHHRRQIARLGQGDSLALPPSVVDYLERLRSIGTPDEAVDGERDAWIITSATAPELIDEWMTEKHRQLDDPRVQRFYRGMADLLADDVDDARLVETAELLCELADEHAARGGLERDDERLPDPDFVALLDAFAADAHPVTERLQDLLEERGWTGWTDMRPTGPREAETERPHDR